jgi:hypothetical protein
MGDSFSLSCDDERSDPAILSGIQRPREPIQTNLPTVYLTRNFDALVLRKFHKAADPCVTVCLPI